MDVVGGQGLPAAILSEEFDHNQASVSDGGDLNVCWMNIELESEEIRHESHGV